MSRRRARVNRRAVALALVALCAALPALAPALAHADGDPASDVLVSQPLFVPYDTGVSSARQARLEALLRETRRAGSAVRVALIPGESDLGSVGVLWHHPRAYARFLGIELSLTYGQRLLVAMPNGFGYNWPQHPTARAYAALVKIPIPGGGAGLLTATESAIEQIAAAEGIHLSPASAAPSATAAGARAGSSTHAGTWALLALACVLAALASGASLRPALRDARHGAPTAGGRAPQAARAAAGAATPRAAHARVRWALRGLAVLCLCAAVPLALAGFRGGASAAGTAAGEAPTVWAPGERPAPSLRLTDQQGRSVSLAAYRGRPVIVTFVDPFRRAFCPPAACVLNEADARLPAAQRPAIVTVSVDVDADARRDLLEDSRRWGLVPQWRWAVGAPPALAAAWRGYHVEVTLETKHIAGVSFPYVTHSQVAYVIDAAGDERALFSWPFTARQVDAELRALARP
jgi:protein SCO1/2